MYLIVIESQEVLPEVLSFADHDVMSPIEAPSLYLPCQSIPFFFLLLYVHTIKEY